MWHSITTAKTWPDDVPVLVKYRSAGTREMRFHLFEYGLGAEGFESIRDQTGKELRMTMPLILSLFPGIGLLDMAFELEGFCVVRGPDVLWGGDVARFHPPAGRFDGVIGGPPCQKYSAWGSIIDGSGGKRAFGNLIPEFERVITEAKPTWFVMENVRAAPIPQPLGYSTSSTLLNNRWCVDDDGKAATQNRVRRFTFGDSRRGYPTAMMIDTAVFENRHFEYAATIGGGHRKDRPAQAAAMEKNGLKSRHSEAAFNHFKMLQGLSEDFDLPGFSSREKVRAICNGVPLPMGRAIARAVKELLSLTEGSQDGRNSGSPAIRVTDGQGG